MRRLPPLNAVKAFEATARLSSVTAAAQELSVSHSAVSQQIKQLEDWFGQKLFSRPGRRVEPTAAALSYLEDVRAALDRIALASEHLANRGSRRVLTINCTPSFALRWLIPRTADFQIANPTLQLQVTTSTLDGFQHLDAPYDIVVRREPMVREGYVCECLVDDVSTPVLSPSLLGERVMVEPADLLGLTKLHCKSRSQAWKQWFSKNGVHLPDTVGGTHFDHFFLSIEAAASGLGVALAPLALIDTDLATGRLMAPFPERTIARPGFHVLFRPQLAQERAGRALLRWLESKTGVGLMPGHVA